MRYFFAAIIFIILVFSFVISRLGFWETVGGMADVIFSLIKWALGLVVSLLIFLGLQSLLEQKPISHSTSINDDFRVSNYERESNEELEREDVEPLTTVRVTRKARPVAPIDKKNVEQVVEEAIVTARVERKARQVAPQPEGAEPVM